MNFVTKEFDRRIWGGKKKAITFSFDDGVTQDIRLIEILNKYDLKATFNINSSLLGRKNELVRNGKAIRHDKIAPYDLKRIYEGHEIAAHTLTHPNLTTLDREEIIKQVELDRRELSDLCGYEVVGMAYPCGGVNNDDRVAEIIKTNTGIKYARTITSTHSFDRQENLFRFNPTVYYIENELDAVIDSFFKSDSTERELLYIWGHSYEMDAGYISWDRFDEVCRRLSGHEDVFYGTNKDVLLFDNLGVVL